MPNGQGGDGLYTCSHCGARLNGGGHGGAEYCNTATCPGNYYGGKPQTFGPYSPQRMDDNPPMRKRNA